MPSAVSLPSGVSQVTLAVSLPGSAILSFRLGHFITGASTSTREGERRWGKEWLKRSADVEGRETGREKQNVIFPVLFCHVMLCYVMSCLCNWGDFRLEKLLWWSAVSPSRGWKTTLITYSWLGFPCIGKIEQLPPVKTRGGGLSITADARNLIFGRLR